MAVSPGKRRTLGESNPAPSSTHSRSNGRFKMRFSFTSGIIALAAIFSAPVASHAIATRGQCIALDDQSQALGIQNQARRALGLQPIKWSTDLAANAQSWANHLAQIGRSEHSSGGSSSGQGENLYWQIPAASGYSSAASYWVSEKSNYHGELIGDGNFVSYAHYSKWNHINSAESLILTLSAAQIVWWKTNYVGMGAATDSSGRIWVVARYSPAGNT